MSKIASYLRGHVSGDVVVRDDVREFHGADAGVIKIKPEMVIYPRNTNDIRKVLRFSWQLAEKGHIVPITVQGGNTDSTGASIGGGIILHTPTYMNQVYEYDIKQKLVRVQPGVFASSLQSAISLYGTGISALVGSPTNSTIGGAVANASVGPLAGKYGSILKSISQLEVVLANGDVLQTKRVSKKELNRKKGLQGIEGDIYRGVDGIIDEYADVIDKLSPDDMVGYSSIADVKHKDGSFDLAPLFVGSQGTLGVISEMILKTEFISKRLSMAVLTFVDSGDARDALDDLAKQNPAVLEYYDAELFNVALKSGHEYKFYTDAMAKFKPQAVVAVLFDEFNERTRLKQLSKIVKKFTNNTKVSIVDSGKDEPGVLLSVLDVANYVSYPDNSQGIVPNIFGDFHIPADKLEVFVKSLQDYATKEHISLPIAGHAITNTYWVYPLISLDKVSDKQRLFKILDALAKQVTLVGGNMIAEGGEGRLKARSIYPELDERVVAMYDAIRKVFDQKGTLNTGVKQINSVQVLASQLKNVPPIVNISKVGF